MSLTDKSVTVLTSCGSIDECDGSLLIATTTKAQPVYWNVVQTATAVCVTSGATISVSVASNQYFSFTSQANADALALAAAQASVNLQASTC